MFFNYKNLSVIIEYKLVKCPPVLSFRSDRVESIRFFGGGVKIKHTRSLSCKQQVDPLSNFHQTGSRVEQSIIFHFVSLPLKSSFPFINKTRWTLVWRNHSVRRDFLILTLEIRVYHFKDSQL